MLHGVSETPITWEEHLSPSSLSMENLDVLAEEHGPSTSGPESS